MMRSTWRNGENSRKAVKEILRSRYNDEIAEAFNPETDVMTIKKINEYGMRVKKGEKAIRITCLCEKRDENGEVIARFPRKVNLFHVKLQCEKAGK